MATSLKLGLLFGEHKCLADKFIWTFVIFKSHQNKGSIARAFNIFDKYKKAGVSNLL